MSEITPEANPEFEARAQLILNNWRAGDISFAEALECFSTLKFEAIQREYLLGEALTERLMGVVRAARGNAREALRHFRTAHEMYERLSEWRLLLLCNNNIAEVHRQRGEFERAHWLFVRTYADAEAKGFTDIQVYCKANDGRTLLNMKKHEEALVTLRQALQLAGQPHLYDALQGLTTLIYSDLALTYLALQDYSQALAHAQHALVIGEECKDIRRIAQAQRTLGRVLSVYAPAGVMEISDPDHYFQASIHACREGHFDAEIVFGLYHYSESLAARGQLESAVAHALEALSICERIGMVAELENIRAFLNMLQSTQNLGQ